MMHSKKQRNLILGGLFLSATISFFAIIQFGILINHTKNFVIADLLSTNTNFVYLLFLWGAVVLTITKITPFTAVRYPYRRQVLLINFKEAALIDVIYALTITVIAAGSLQSNDFYALLSQLFLPLLMTGWLNTILILIIYYLVSQNLLLTNALYLGLILINCWLPFFSKDQIKPYNILLTISWWQANWPLHLLASILVGSALIQISKEVIQRMEVY